MAAVALFFSFCFNCWSDQREREIKRKEEDNSINFN